jgi:hypothetical protein
MATMTITEALAEVKTIGKRIEKKREFIRNYALRQEMVKDPLLKDGGSEKLIQESAQAISDLSQRLIVIRRRVQEKNMSTTITILDTTRSVTDWLTWRKEVAPGQVQFVANLRLYLEKTREQMRTKGVTVGATSVDLKPTDIVVAVDEGMLAKTAETFEEILGTLDGKLSLINATTTIEI